MKFITFFALFFSFAATLQANPLRSDKLRKLICTELNQMLENTDLLLEREYQLFQNITADCSQSKESFTVESDGVIFNDIFKEVVILNVVINYESSEGIYFTGGIKLDRFIDIKFDTGEIELGPWKIAKSDAIYTFDEKAVAKIANALVSVANVHNGAARIEKYETATFSREAELQKLEIQIKKENTGSNCKQYVESNISSAYSLIDDAEDFAYGSAHHLIEFLRNQEQVETLFATTVEEWSESCAYYDIYIYLKNGAVITLNYDFTT